MKVFLPLEPGAVALETQRRAVRGALDRQFPLDDLHGLSRTTRHAAAMFWSERAWSEYAALPALSQVLLAHVREHAPLSETAVVASVVNDEALHTELSRHVAEALGGYVADIPEAFGLNPLGLAEPRALSLAHWLVAGGAIGETISRALIQARLPHTKAPSVRKIVLQTLRDENRHVAFTWSTLARVVRPLSRAQKNELADFAEPTLAAAFRFQCTSSLAAPTRASERKLRQRVADAGLGACSPEEEDATVERVITEVIRPGLRKVGVRL